jgi:hypothetical protein
VLGGNRGDDSQAMAMMRIAIVSRGRARTAVGHRDPDPARERRRIHPHPQPAVKDRVVDQVVQRLPDPLGVHHHEGCSRAPAQDERAMRRSGHAPPPLDRGLHDGSAGDRTGLEAARTAVDGPVEVAQRGQRDADARRPGVPPYRRGKDQLLKRSPQLVEREVQRVATSRLPDALPEQEPGEGEPNRPARRLEARKHADLRQSHRLPQRSIRR